MSTYDYANNPNNDPALKVLLQDFEHEEHGEHDPRDPDRAERALYAYPGHAFYMAYKFAMDGRVMLVVRNLERGNYLAFDEFSFDIQPGEYRVLGKYEDVAKWGQPREIAYTSYE